MADLGPGRLVLMLLMSSTALSPDLPSGAYVPTPLLSPAELEDMTRGMYGCSCLLRVK